LGIAKTPALGVVLESELENGLRKPLSLDGAPQYHIANSDWMLNNL
jgi:hypothetical protein